MAKRASPARSKDNSRTFGNRGTGDPLTRNRGTGSQAHHAAPSATLPQPPNVEPAQRSPSPGAIEVMNRFQSMGELQWVVGAAPGGCNTDFCRWATADEKGKAPPIAPTTTANCWDAILLAAYHCGVVSWQWLHDLYSELSHVDIADILSSGQRRRYAPPLSAPIRGDFVFFWKEPDYLSHVALATGRLNPPGRSPEVVGFQRRPGTRGGPSKPEIDEPATIIVNKRGPVVIDYGVPPW